MVSLIKRLCGVAAVLSLIVSCGGGGGSAGAPPPDPSSSGISVLAGDTGQSGFADGTGRRARFRLPSAIAVDAAGNVFVAETFNSAIRKVTPQGVVTTPYPSAGRVRDLAFAPDGELYFTANDEQFAGVFRASPSGAVTPVVAAGVIRAAWSIAVGNDGTVYVSSPTGIHKFKPGAAPVLMASLPKLVQQLVVDSAGNLYGSMITEDEIRTVDEDGPVGLGTGITVIPARSTLVVQVRPDGSWVPYAGSPTEPRYADGPRADARFSNASGMALDASGRLWVADNHADGRQSGMMRRISADGIVSSPFGTRTLFRYGRSADVAFDRQGALYILSGNGVAKVSPSGEVTALAGSHLPAPEEQAPLVIHQLAVGAGGEIYTAETVDTLVKVRKFDGAGRRVPFGPDGQGVTLDGLTPRDVGTLGTLAMVVDGGGVIHLSYARVQRNAGGADGLISKAVGGAIVRITPQGQLSTVPASTPFAPSGLAVDPQGDYRYLDLIDGRLRRRPAGGGTPTVFSPSVLPTTSFTALPRFGAASGAPGWVIDYVNQKLLAFNDTGSLVELAGNGRSENGVDGRGPAASFASLQFGVEDRGNL